MTPVWDSVVEGYEEKSKQEGVVPEEKPQISPLRGDESPSDDHSPWKRHAPLCPLSIPITDPKWKRRPPLVIPRSRLACGKLREQ